LTVPWVIGPEPDYVQVYGSEPDQLIEFFDGGQTTIACIHGGYWRPTHNREHMRALAAKLANSGYKVANIEYRREPLKPEKTFDDVNRALLKINPVASIGFSVGGQLALFCAGNIHKIILLAPVTDLTRTKVEALGENAVDAFFGDQSIDTFDPMLKEYKNHLYLIHGDADTRVPISHSRDFVKAKGGSLMEISGGDHFSVIAPEGLAFDLILKSLA